MGENTEISWCDHTFNPVIGCQKVSAACDFCYAETLMDTRLGRVEWGPHGERKRTSAANWRQPLAWNRKAEADGVRRRVFCASLADVFDNRRPAGARDDLWQLIYETPHLIWMLLTKRPQNIAKMLPIAAADFDIRERIWLGTTAENQEEADRRIPVLLENRAAVHFVSAEPLLGPLNIEPYLRCGGCGYTEADKRFHMDHRYCRRQTAALKLVITGGESGRNARPSHPDWFRSIRDQCVAAAVAYHHKQNGEWELVRPHHRLAKAQVRNMGMDLEPHVRLMIRVGKKRAGRLLDGRTWDQMPA